MAKLRGRATPPGQGGGSRAGGSSTRKAGPSKPARADEGAKRRRSSASQPSASPPGKRTGLASARGASKTPKRAASTPKGATTPKRAQATPKRAASTSKGATTLKGAEAALPSGAPTAKRIAPPAARVSEATTAKRISVDGGKPAVKSDEQPASAAGRLMELHWGDSPPPPSSRALSLVQRWMKRGDVLLRHLAEHGAARHEYRADLREGRFVWISPEGRVSAEARAQVICSYAPTTRAIAMGWADPLIRSVAIPRLDGMPPERDNVDEEGAWRVAMHAADLACAEYLYRVTTPHAWYFLALRQLTFTPERSSFTPGTPVGLVLRSLIETRQAIESRAEPTEVVRARLAGVGQALLQEASYAYRGTDWVARLERTGKCLLHLADRLPRESFHSVAAGRQVEEWLDREATVELSKALVLLEDEWSLFA